MNAHESSVSEIRVLDLGTLHPSENAQLPELHIREGESMVAIAVPEPNRPIVCRFVLAPSAKLFLRTLVRPGTSSDFEVRLEGESSQADVRAVAISQDFLPASYVSRTVSLASKTRASSEIAAFALSNGDLSITTSAEIGPGVFAAYAEAVQSNILFGETAKVRGIPELKIASDDVKARHSCSVERFSDDKLFYLRSRGLSAPKATASLVSAKTSHTFS